MMANNTLETVAFALTCYFVADRFVRAAAMAWYFGRSGPALPAELPKVSLIQPITRGVAGLSKNLEARAAQTYPNIEHILVCDEQDAFTLEAVRAYLDAHPALDAKLLLAPPDEGGIAFKTTKIKLATACATGKILCFIDDDIRPWPNNIADLVAHLGLPSIGVVFGLARAISFNGFWSALMSGFVNAYALPSYVPNSLVVKPFTVTGHIFALTRATFERVGGFEKMEDRIDDDHEIARRTTALGLGCMQTRVIYDVGNDMPDRKAFNNQMKRWFVIPRQTLFPHMSAWQHCSTTALNLMNFMPPVVLLMAVFGASAYALSCFAVMFAAYALVHFWMSVQYLKLGHVATQLYTLFIVMILVPFQIIAALLSRDTFQWRGQTFTMRNGKVVRSHQS